MNSELEKQFMLKPIRGVYVKNTKKHIKEEVHNAFNNIHISEKDDKLLDKSMIKIKPRLLTTFLPAAFIINTKMSANQMEPTITPSDNIVYHSQTITSNYNFVIIVNIEYTRN